MARAGIRDRCRVDVSENEDSFVGIRCGTDEISVQFPLGFEFLLMIKSFGGTFFFCCPPSEGLRQRGSRSFPVWQDNTV